MAALALNCDSRAEAALIEATNAAPLVDSAAKLAAMVGIWASALDGATFSMPAKVASRVASL